MTATLYPFQEQAVQELLDGKHMVRIDTGGGKTAVMFNWLKRVDAKKILIIAVPSKIKSGDFIKDAELFCGKGWAEQRHIEYVSWYKLADWASEHVLDENEYYVAADELQMSKAGVSSKRGKAFLNIAKRCKGWTGYTATPGDAWIDFYPYFVASGKFRTKTYFLQNFCNRQTYPFPKIVSYCNTDTLNEWWKEIATIPDTTEVFAQLPKATHQQVHFKKPKGYDKVMKECKTLDGEPLESNMAMAHYLRQLCDTKDKQEWLEDFLSSLSSSLVLFYNYACERENILKICQKLKRKVWRIDGQKHEIPTPETIGKNDVVLVHYASGSASLNLQFMNYWLSYSPNYSYTTSTQARGRIRRIGQERPQFFYYFRTDKTIEDAVFKALASKKDFTADIWLADNGVNRRQGEE